MQTHAGTDSGKVIHEDSSAPVNNKQNFLFRCCLSCDSYLCFMLGFVKCVLVNSGLQYEGT